MCRWQTEWARQFGKVGQTRRGQCPGRPVQRARSDLGGAESRRREHVAVQLVDRKRRLISVKSGQLRGGEVLRTVGEHDAVEIASRPAGQCRQSDRLVWRGASGVDLCVLDTVR